MKKVILTSSLAAVIGITGFTGVTGHEAHASEQSQGNHTSMVQFVKSGAADSKPYQAGNYNYQFTENGYDYHLYSDGVNFGYDYHQSGQSEQSGVQHKNSTQNTNQQNVKHESKQNTMQLGNKSIKLPESHSSSVKLSNGNTAGATGSSAAQEMAKRTGVSASTWETIIARESNGNTNAQNASGASGLFQTMPSWGDTSSVDGQIDAAVKAYNAQGLSAWGM